ALAALVDDAQVSIPLGLPTWDHAIDLVHFQRRGIRCVVHADGEPTGRLFTYSHSDLVQIALPIAAAAANRRTRLSPFMRGRAIICSAEFAFCKFLSYLITDAHCAPA